MGLLSTVRQTLAPAARGTGTNVPGRGDDYGNIFTREATSQFTSALEGSLFVARHLPVVGGTNVAIAVQVAFVDTTPVLVLNNADAAKKYIPLYIRARVTAAGASTTSSEVSAEVDNINRVTSGGTSLAVNGVNTDASAPASNAIVTVGAITSPAAGARRKFVGSAIAKIAASPLFLVNDVLLMTFGAAASFVHQGNVIASDAAAPVATSHIPFAACVVQPGGSLVINMANVANAVTPPGFEWEAAWVEF